MYGYLGAIRLVLPSLGSPDLNAVIFCIWGVLKRNVYRGRRITNILQLKRVFIEEWEKFPQEAINNAINGMRRGTHGKVLSLKLYLKSINRKQTKKQHFYVFLSILPAAKLLPRHRLSFFYFPLNFFIF